MSNVFGFERILDAAGEARGTPFVGVGRRIGDSNSVPMAESAVPVANPVPTVPNDLVVAEAELSNPDLDAVSRDLVTDAENIQFRNMSVEDSMKMNAMMMDLTYTVKKSQLVHKIRLQSKLIDKRKELLRAQALAAKAANKINNIDIDCVLAINAHDLDIRKKALRRRRILMK